MRDAPCTLLILLWIVLKWLSAIELQNKKNLKKTLWCINDKERSSLQMYNAVFNGCLVYSERRSQETCVERASWNLSWVRESVAWVERFWREWVIGMWVYKRFQWVLLLLVFQVKWEEKFRWYWNMMWCSVGKRGGGAERRGRERGDTSVWQSESIPYWLIGKFRIEVIWPHKRAAVLKQYCHMILLKIIK